MERAEPGGCVTVEGGAEELDQAVTEHGVEDVLGQLRLLAAVEEAGRDDVVPPGGQLGLAISCRGDGDRVQFGGLIEAIAAAGAEERVQVVLGADFELGVRGPCQREVEEDEFRDPSFLADAGPGCRA